MSGRKVTYVSVDASELRQLRKAEKRLARVRADVPRLLDGVRRQMREEFSARVHQIDERQQRFDDTISTLSTTVREVETRTQQRLQAHAREIRRQVNDDVSQVRANMTTALDEQAAQFDAALASETAARERAIDDVTRHVSDLRETIDADRQRAECAARQWLADAQVLRAFISNEYAHERHAPGRLSAIDGQLTQAERSAQDGLWQAAVAVAQEGYKALSELRGQLELKERELQVLQTETRAALIELRSRAEADARLRMTSDGTAPEAQDEDMFAASYIDFWTRGGLRAVHVDATTLLGQIDDDRLGRVGLQTLLSETLPRLNDDLDALAEQAETAEIESQVRVSIADRVVQVLHRNGYASNIEGGYERGDQRGRFLAQAEHEDGSRVVVTVRPVDGRTELAVNSFDEGITSEEERAVRTRALAGQLRGEGLELAGLPEAMAGPDERVYDVLSLVRDDEHATAGGAPHGETS